MKKTLKHHEKQWKNLLKTRFLGMLAENINNGRSPKFHLWTSCRTNTNPKRHWNCCKSLQVYNEYQYGYRSKKILRTTGFGLFSLFPIGFLGYPFLTHNHILYTSLFYFYTSSYSLSLLALSSLFLFTRARRARLATAQHGGTRCEEMLAFKEPS